MEETRTLSTREKVEKAVLVFVLGYGLNYIAYFLRARYLDWLAGLALDPGLSHILRYFGHLVFLAVFLLYALAVRGDRRYIVRPLRRAPGVGALLGAAMGFTMMGLCILAASLHGDLVVRPSASVSVPLFLLAFVAVVVQATVEELESRTFVFGKMSAEGVPLVPAVLLSAFFFSYLHMANPGYGLLPLLSLFLRGCLYALAWHYFRNLWFMAASHTLWNFTQDFLFGLPDSGHPAAVSVFSTEVRGSGFFYDEAFGIEGSWMAVLVSLAACALLVLAGRKLARRGRQPRS